MAVLLGLATGTRKTRGPGGELRGFSISQAAVAAAASRSRLHAAALSTEISVREPTFMMAGPQPSRCILKYWCTEKPCNRQNSAIDIARECESARTGFRSYFG